MLLLYVTDIDICRISSILGKYHLKVYTDTKSTIIIDNDEIPEDVVDLLFANTTIIGAQNYPIENSNPGDNLTEISTYECVENSSENITENKDISETQEVADEMPRESLDIPSASAPKKLSKSEMVFRGEVYKWGSIRSSDDGHKIKECIIIIQNDYQNSASEDTVGLFCTSNYEERAPMGFSFQLMPSTMVDYNKKKLGVFNCCTLFVGRIKCINRNQLGMYLGTMTNMFMDTLQPTIDFCLGLKRSRTVDMAQLQMLSTINIEDLFKISESKVNNNIKVEKFLELFGFDISLDGAEYVKEAILIAHRMSDYSLEYLAYRISEENDVEADEVLNVIVARIKENFNFNKSHAMSFIRLIERLLKG